MVESLVAALVAALCYGVAAVMQAMAVRTASHRPPPGAVPADGEPPGPPGGGEPGLGVDPGLVVRMLRQWPFVASIGIDLVGFIGQLVALARLPLFAVQAIISANLAVTAVFAAWLMHVRLSLREWLAVTGVVVGVGLLGSSAGAEGAARVGFAFKLGLIVAVAGVAVAGVAAARLPHRYRTPVLGAVAGLGYAVLAVSARILPGFSPAELVRDPATYTLAAAGIVSFMLYASALDGGSVTVATAAVVLAETAPPAVVGLALLGDTTRPGLETLAAAGFVLAVCCAVALARFGEASEQQAATSGEAEDPDMQVDRPAALGRRDRE
jgi:drug/metabolite transporter (DMT)-like permease